jgi:4'-phosphopantetheinyl transferase
MSGQPRPAGLPLSTAHADLWLIPTTLPEPVLTYLASILSPAERERVKRLRIPAKRLEALVARGMLRHLLGTFLQTSPAMLTFDMGAQGKPYLHEAGGGARSVQFNLSHTAGWVLIGMTQGQAIGVDIETIRPRSSMLELATRFFTTAEAASILALPGDQQVRAFFTVWCRKEAVLKAAGQGIAAGLNSFEVPIHTVMNSFAVRFAEQDWWVHDVDVGAVSEGMEALAASVAVEKRETALRLWSCPEMMGTPTL